MMKVDPNSIKFCVVMMILGAATFGLVLMSAVIVVYQFMIGVFILNSVAIYAAAVILSLITYHLDKKYWVKN